MKWFRSWKTLGIYRLGEEMQEGVDKLAELRERFKNVKVEDKTKVYNTELLLARAGWLADGG